MQKNTYVPRASGLTRKVSIASLLSALALLFQVQNAFAQACPTAPATAQPVPTKLNSNFGLNLGDRIASVAPASAYTSVDVTQRETRYAVLQTPAVAPATCPTFSWTPQTVNLRPQTGQYALITVYGNPATIQSLRVGLSDGGQNPLITQTFTLYAFGVQPANISAAVWAARPNIAQSASVTVKTFALPLIGGMAQDPTRIFPALIGATAPGKYSVAVTVEAQGTNWTEVQNSSTGNGYFRAALMFDNPSVIPTVSVNQCLATPIVVRTYDGVGAPVAAEDLPTRRQTYTIDVAGSPANLYLDSACLYPTTALQIRDPNSVETANEAATRGARPKDYVSSSYAQFYFKSTSVQDIPVTIRYRDGATGLASGPMSRIVRVTGDIPSNVRLAGPGSTNQNQCSAAFTATLIDRYANETDARSTRVFTLATGSAARFYSDANCVQPITTLTYGTGERAKSFYLSGPRVEQANVIITDSVTGVNGIQGAQASIFVLSLGMIPAIRDVVRARNVAIRLMDRLTGVPVSLNDTQLQQMTVLLQQGRILEAANIATSRDDFYNVTVKNLATPLSNRPFNTLEPFNDFTATWVGTVRDGKDARELLTGNTIYVGSSLQPANLQSCANSSVYKNNSHYQALEDNEVNLRQDLRPARQCAYNTGRDSFNQDNPVLLGDSAGLITTRTWGVNHLFMGTNRRGIEYAMKVFLCKDMHNDLMDSSIADDRIRRDVDRSPGGQPAVYRASCRACHSGMDALAGAYAYFDAYYDMNNAGSMNSDFRLFYVPGGGGYYAQGVMPKNNINNTVFPPGYVVGSDAWANRWADGRNAALGWDANTPSEGQGINGVGRLLANSRAFSSCMSMRVFKEMCRRAPDASEMPLIDELESDFRASSYNMRRLYERAATLGACLGKGD